MHDLPPRPPVDEVDRTRIIVIAGHQGDLATARAGLADPAGSVRAAALGALARCGELNPADVRTSLDDPDHAVRLRAAELAAHVDGVDPSPALNDPDNRVVEVACFACGEQTWPTATAPIAALADIATTHDDPMCRESAAAALGAIGDPAGLEAVLHACTDRVTVRRRAILALAAFDDDRADAALTAALDDRDWQVRQAAEDLLEVGRSLDGDPDPDAYAT